jgi:3-dehydroquinate synthase
MKPLLTIRQASAAYPVYVGPDLLARTGTIVPARGRVFVITAKNLRARFGETVAASFSPAATIIEVDDGESRKTIDTAMMIVGELLEHGARRDSMAVVVGGGMIGDTAGFAASIFLRGIDLVHVPTTLLAQVDSSIGGKLAVNHPKGKNLIGSFFPPRAVIADTTTFASLPPRELLSGLYEALKGGIIGDAELFGMFEDLREEITAREPQVIESLVKRAIRVKAEIVSADEKEADVRRLLNYGHTLAHGFETAMNYEGITHGEAVAWGMIAANAIAVRRGILSSEESSRMEQAILAYEPMPLPAIDRTLVLAAAEHDKKNTGTARVMVFPKRVGECVVVSDVTEEELAYGADAVLSGKREK